MDRSDNKYIFEDTMKRIERSPVLSRAVRNSIDNEKLILEKDEYIPSVDIIYPDNAKIVVSRKRTLEAAVG